MQNSRHPEEVICPRLQRADGQGVPSTPGPPISGRVRRDVDEEMGCTCYQTQVGQGEAPENELRQIPPAWATAQLEEPFLSCSLTVVRMEKPRS